MCAYGPGGIATIDSAMAVLAYPIYDGIEKTGEGNIPLMMGALLAKVARKIPLSVDICKGMKATLDYYPLPGLVERYELRAMLHVGDKGRYRITSVSSVGDELHICCGDLRVSVHVAGLGDTAGNRLEHKGQQEGYIWNAITN